MCNHAKILNIYLGYKKIFNQRERIYYNTLGHKNSMISENNSCFLIKCNFTIQTEKFIMLF